ncbi:hypothetical protein GCM10009801_48690 [Streptomyces albiaxialis]|uniref:Uncharacterized protein n=1 Tax=Streptomyces albiaxialis TaxID=329523 RepID=A0ABN2WAR3_9ACTN
MSGSGDLIPSASAWAVERFGRQAGALTRAIPVQLARAHVVHLTADPENGIHAIHWGQARLEPDRTFTWPYSEPLPLAPPEA